MADSFRNLANMLEPDPYWAAVPGLDPQTLEPKTTTLEDIHRALCEIHLDETVPAQVQIHFDTTRNLALYSWFVRNFIQVADWHACASLELALKTKTKGKIGYLPNLIRHAIDNGWIKNEGFSDWQRQKAIFEQQLPHWQQLHEAMGQPFDPPNGGEFAWDYVSILLKLLPTMRNEYAHGSTMLYPGTVNLRVVAEFINQLFPSGNPKKKHT